MIDNDEGIEGNRYIFFLFQVCNIGLSILGVLTIIIAIYLIGLTSSLNSMNFFIFVFGIIFIVLSYFGFKLRFSPAGNLLYLTVLSGFFVCDFFLTILVFFRKDSVINWVVEQHKDSKSINQLKSMISLNLDIANSFLLVILLLFVK